MLLFSHFFLPVFNTSSLLGGGRFWNLLLLYSRQVLCLLFLPLLLQIPQVVRVRLCGLLRCWCTVPVLLFSLQDAGFLCRAAKNRFSLPIFCWPEQFTWGQSECKGVLLFSSRPPVLSGGWAPFERQPCASLRRKKNTFERTESINGRRASVRKWKWANMPDVFSIYAWEHPAKWCFGRGIRLKGLGAQSPPRSSIHAVQGHLAPAYPRPA